ncbi:MAG: helix-turn-helix domain-containing protein [Alteromonadaceae bacterium]|nr:helix-turn-helix domain-containing protein [Alteromonadaceae bacterium]
MQLKKLRLSKHLSQEQLAEMAGINVRTIQRLESGKNPSIETQKCLAAALEIDIDTLNQEEIVIDKRSENWQNLPVWLKAWFVFNTLKLQPERRLVARMEKLLHGFGFSFCVAGLFSEPGLVGGIVLLANGYFMSLIKYQGDKYAIW